MTLNLRRFVFDGDSHIAGNGDVPNAPPSLIHNFANFQPCQFSNVAVNGAVALDCLNRYPTTTRPLSPIVTGVPASYWLQVGSNNIGRGDTGASTYATIASLLVLAKADGFFIGVTQPWSDPAWVSDGRQTQLLILNAALATDPSLTSGMIIDGVALFPNPNTLPNFPTGDNHCNPTGQQVYANQFKATFASSGNFL